MNPPRSGARRRLVPPLSAVMACSAALSFATACSESKNSDSTTISVEESGRLRLNLTGTSPSNLTYQLRSGTFTLVGLETGFTTAVSTEEDPNRESLLVELVPDEYRVTLEPGFELYLLNGAQARRARSERSAQKFPSSRAGSVASAPDAGIVDPPPPFFGTPVQAELISPNPAQVTVYEDAVSSLGFVFRVGDDAVRTGLLDIFIEVQDDEGGGQPPVSCTDPFEPNDTLETAAPITGDIDLATLCSEDQDFYSFTPPGQVGDDFAVTVSFSHEAGDIDAFLLNSLGEVVSFGESVSDDEVLTGVVDGNPFTLQAFLFGSPSVVNEYSVTMGEGGAGPENSCCQTSSNPGCSDPEIEECVCAADPFCCLDGFDALCVEQALSCGAECGVVPPPPPPPPPGVPGEACCGATGEPGCGNPQIEECVCAVDEFCCTTNYDELCAEIAVVQCSVDCSG